MSTICIKYRIYPTKSQTRFLEETLDTCRTLYNSLLNSRKYEYEVNQKSLTCYNQIDAIKSYKSNNPELLSVHSQVLQNVAVRVDLAFKAFFQRVKKGQTPGFPRFKSKGYDSFCYPQSGYKLNDNSVELSKIGVVKAKIHRKLEGNIKTCTVRRQSGKWYACFAVETEFETLPINDNAVGIDVGLEKFAALSNNTYIQIPRFFRKDEKSLAKAQKKTSKYNGKQRAKAKKIVSKIHEKIRNRRHNFIHQESRKIINTFGIIILEDLNVKNMSKSPVPKPDPENEGKFLPNGASQKAGLNKSILDAGWTMFRNVISYKAENAGRKYIEVNPAYTSQDCHNCGYRPDGKDGRAKKTLKDRWHNCPKCLASLDRDMNAAINIMSLGMQRLGIALGEA